MRTPAVSAVSAASAASPSAQEDHQDQRHTYFTSAVALQHKTKLKETSESKYSAGHWATDAGGLRKVVWPAPGHAYAFDTPIFADSPHAHKECVATTSPAWSGDKPLDWMKDAAEAAGRREAADIEADIERQTWNVHLVNQRSRWRTRSGHIAERARSFERQAAEATATATATATGSSLPPSRRGSFSHRRRSPFPEHFWKQAAESGPESAHVPPGKRWASVGKLDVTQWEDKTKAESHGRSAAAHKNANVAKWLQQSGPRDTQLGSLAQQTGETPRDHYRQPPHAQSMYQNQKSKSQTSQQLGQEREQRLGLSQHHSASNTRHEKLHEKNRSNGDSGVFHARPAEIEAADDPNYEAGLGKTCLGRETRRTEFMAHREHYIREERVRTESKSKPVESEEGEDIGEQQRRRFHEERIKYQETRSQHAQPPQPLQQSFKWEQMRQEQASGNPIEAQQEQHLREQRQLQMNMNLQAKKGQAEQERVLRQKLIKEQEVLRESRRQESAFRVDSEREQRASVALAPAAVHAVHADEGFSGRRSEVEAASRRSSRPLTKARSLTSDVESPRPQTTDALGKVQTGQVHERVHFFIRSASSERLDRLGRGPRRKWLGEQDWIRQQQHLALVEARPESAHDGQHVKTAVHDWTQLTKSRSSSAVLLPENTNTYKAKPVKVAVAANGSAWTKEKYDEHVSAVQSKEVHTNQVNETIGKYCRHVEEAPCQPRPVATPTRNIAQAFQESKLGLDRSETKAMAAASTAPPEVKLISVAVEKGRQMQGSFQSSFNETHVRKSEHHHTWTEASTHQAACDQTDLMVAKPALTSQAGPSRSARRQPILSSKESLSTDRKSEKKQQDQTQFHIKEDKASSLMLDSGYLLNPQASYVHTPKAESKRPEDTMGSSGEDVNQKQAALRVIGPNPSKIPFSRGTRPPQPPQPPPLPAPVKTPTAMASRPAASSVSTPRPVPMPVVQSWFTSPQAATAAAPLPISAGAETFDVKPEAKPSEAKTREAKPPTPIPVLAGWFGEEQREKELEAKKQKKHVDFLETPLAMETPELLETNAPRVRANVALFEQGIPPERRVPSGDVAEAEASEATEAAEAAHGRVKQSTAAYLGRTLSREAEAEQRRARSHELEEVARCRAQTNWDEQAADDTRSEAALRDARALELGQIGVLRAHHADEQPEQVLAERMLAQTRDERARELQQIAAMRAHTDWEEGTAAAKQATASKIQQRDTHAPGPTRRIANLLGKSASEWDEAGAIMAAGDAKPPPPPPNRDSSRGYINGGSKRNQRD